MKPMIDRCRETSRPAFIDMRTYRYKGHSMSDPRKYRTKEEEETYEAKDAIEKLAAHLKREHGFADDEYAAMTKDVKKQVRAAVKWATDSPAPDLTELYTDVYTGFWGPYQGTSLPEMMRGSDE
jgi:pyruvate dehydrogenase E1 component alpha subunit